MVWQPFQKVANPTTKGVDVTGYAEFMQKFGGVDPTDEYILQRLFDVTNTRGAFYVTFEQCVEMLRILKKGDTVAKPVRERKVKDDKIEVDGVVTEALPSANFRAEIGATKQVLLCTISGKIRKNFVKILVGDSVKVELSPYDLTRGRITFRERN